MLAIAIQYCAAFVCWWLTNISEVIILQVTDVLKLVNHDIITHLLSVISSNAWHYLIKKKRISMNVLFNTSRKRIISILLKVSVPALDHSYIYDVDLMSTFVLITLYSIFIIIFILQRNGIISLNKSNIKIYSFNMKYI